MVHFNIKVLVIHRQIKDLFISATQHFTDHPTLNLTCLILSNIHLTLRHRIDKMIDKQRMVGCWLSPLTLKTSFSTAGHLEMRRQSWPGLHNVFRSSSSSVRNWQSTTTSNLPTTVSITKREISRWLRSLDVLIITWIVDMLLTTL